MRVVLCLQSGGAGNRFLRGEEGLTELQVSLSEEDTTY